MPCSRRPSPFRVSSKRPRTGSTVTGTGELDALTIAPEVLEDTDAETLADLVVAAVKDATGQAHTMQQALMPQMPGLGL